jgi:hypothetical protein
VTGPGGVFVIDSKHYRGRLQLDPSRRLWHGRYPLAPALRAVSFEADQAAQVLPDPGVVVQPSRSGQTLQAAPNRARPPPRRAAVIATVTRAGQVTVPAWRSTWNWSLPKRPPGGVGAGS